MRKCVFIWLNGIRGTNIGRRFLLQTDTNLIVTSKVYPKTDAYPIEPSKVYSINPEVEIFFFQVPKFQAFECCFSMDNA
jgi:hypothetical protein